MAIRLDHSRLSQTPLLALVLALSGCATVFHGPRKTVQIITEPAGALATVEGQTVTTPGVLVLPRKARNAEIRIEKEGYAPRTFVLSRRTSNAFWWNFVGTAGGAAGPVAGFGLDYATAAAYRPEPALVVVKLAPATVAVASNEGKETP